MTEKSNFEWDGRRECSLDGELALVCLTDKFILVNTVFQIHRWEFIGETTKSARALFNMMGKELTESSLRALGFEEVDHG